MPRLTSSQRTSLVSPQKSTLVFDTNTHTFWFHNGSVWIEMNQNTEWQTTDNHIHNLNTDKVGIGIVPIKSKLEVNGSGESQVVFGSSGQGISFNNYSPTIGMNNYRSTTNSINQFSFYFSRDIHLNPTNGNFQYIDYYSNTSTENVTPYATIPLTVRNNGNVYISALEYQINAAAGANLVVAGTSGVKLGFDAPNIKMKIFSGTTCSYNYGSNSGCNGETTILLGFTNEHVLGVSVYIDVNNYFEYLPPGNNSSGGFSNCNYYYYLEYLTLTLFHPSSATANTLGRPYIAIIYYTN